MKYTRWMIVGLVLAFITLPFIYIGSDYPGITWVASSYTVTADGEVYTHNWDALNVNVYARFAYHILGTRFRPYFLVNAVGCLIMALSCFGCKRFSANFSRAFWTAAVSGVCNLALPFLPYIIKNRNLLIVTLTLFVVQAFFKVVMLVMIADGMQKQVDNFVYMEVGKDLRFGAETWGFCSIMQFVLYFVIMLDILEAVWYVIVIGGMVSICFYIWKLYYYTEKLHLLEDAPGEMEKSSR
ncbi:MAG: hypothetical protein LUE29_04590 [Lachnospiraceae bacterium]|nr:hypothetical protein [Lachnospiraceae bacterium]